MISEHTLSNGTKILLETVEHTDIVSVGFWFLHGSRDESLAEKGLSHFIEHMFFKGTGKRTAFQIALDIDRVGGILNAFTEKEQSCFYCTVTKENIDLAIEILSDMIFHSTFREEEIEKEKLVIINEIKSDEDVPEEIAFELLLSKIWKNHGLSYKITGTIDDVKKISREVLIAFYRERYSQANLLVSIAGNFEVNTVLSQLEVLLPKEKGTVFIPRRIQPVANPVWEYVSGKFNQVQVYTGIHFPVPADIYEFYYFLVFSTAFGESMSSRLFQKIRENKGLCYSICALRYFFSCTVLWTIYANTAPNLLSALVVSLKTELKEIIDTPPGHQEIEDAVSHIIGGIMLAKDDMETRMKRLVRQFLLGGEMHDYPKAIEILKTIRCEHITTIIEKYLKNNNFFLLAYGTKKIVRLKKVPFSLNVPLS
ncbi:MAG: pitrilysin family protein, partial [Spirochaetota bacterium]